MSHIENWGPKLFVPGDGVFSASFPAWAPEADSKEHFSDATPTCFLAWGNYTRPCKGWWFANALAPTTLVSDPNASDVRLKTFSYNMMNRWGGPLPWQRASFLVDVDGGRVIDRQIFDGMGKIETFDQPLTPSSQISFGLFQEAIPGAGSWVEQHVWAYKVAGTYLTTTPRQPRVLTVSVIDFVQGKPVANASLVLVSGGTIIAQGTTDSTGKANLSAYNSTFLLKVYASGYTPYPDEINVDLTQADGFAESRLTYVGGFELPWWWWVIPVGIGGVALTWILVKAAKPSRREQPPVYVVR